MIKVKQSWVGDATYSTLPTKHLLKFQLDRYSRLPPVLALFITGMDTIFIRDFGLYLGVVAMITPRIDLIPPYWIIQSLFSLVVSGVLITVVAIGLSALWCCVFLGKPSPIIDLALGPKFLSSAFHNVSI